MANDDIERRLTSVEAAVERLREQQELTASDASAARVLASGADRDVSEVRAELRAHTSALNALRETQLDFSRRMDRLDGRLDRVDGQLDRVESTLSQGFATVQAGMTVIVDLLGALAPPDEGGHHGG